LFKKHLTKTSFSFFCFGTAMDSFPDNRQSISKPVPPLRKTKEKCMNHKSHFYGYFIIAAFGLILMSSCSESAGPASPVPNTVSGTLLLPESIPDGELLLIICDTLFCGPPGVDFLQRNLATGTSFPYEFNDVAAGSYYIIAWIRFSQAADPQSGDFVGVYDGSLLSNPPTSPNATIATEGDFIFNINMEKVP